MSACKPFFELESWSVGALPIVNQFLEKLDMAALLGDHLEPSDPRSVLPAQTTLMVLVRNLIMERHPLYGLGAWAQSILPSVIDLREEQVPALNDDRVGRALDRLFDADRLSLLTNLVLHMIKTFEIDTRELHNDSTTISLHGSYQDADGRLMRGKPTPAAARGHSKDYRPDLKQLLWILTVTSDGGVPVHFRVCAGNTEDSSTHIETWNRLRDLVGRADFLYVADSKLCTEPNMRYIDDHGGLFVTVMPRSRKEDGLFRQWLTTHTPEWELITEIPPASSRQEPPDTIMAMESPVPDPHGFRILWIFSSHKMKRDSDWRGHRLGKAIRELEELQGKLAGPKCRYRSRKSVAEAVEQILHETQTTEFIKYEIKCYLDIQYRQRMHKGVLRRYRTGARPRYTLNWESDPAAIRWTSKSDGVFPLITNAMQLPALEIFNAYRLKQPVIEKRHDLFKNVLDAAPAYLKNIGRLEALLFLEFIALIVHALIERQLRLTMREDRIKSLPLYPERRACKAPTTDRLIMLFGPLQYHRLRQKGRMVQEFAPELDEVQIKLLEMLDLPTSIYQKL